MNSKNKVILAIVILYFISPVDLALGPVDDAIVALVGYLMRDKNKGPKELDD